ncbi:hypothetical protein MHYP_G00011190, partial [Metynnis hypsauchen]
GSLFFLHVRLRVQACCWTFSLCLHSSLNRSAPKPTRMRGRTELHEAHPEVNSHDDWRTSRSGFVLASITGADRTSVPHMKASQIGLENVRFNAVFHTDTHLWHI